MTKQFGIVLVYLGHILPEHSLYAVFQARQNILKMAEDTGQNCNADSED